MVAEDVTITEEAQAAVSAESVKVSEAAEAVSEVTEILHQEAAVSAREKKVVLAEEVKQEHHRLQNVKADFHLTARLEDRMLQVSQTGRQDVQKAHLMHLKKEGQEKANRLLLIFL